MTLTLVPHLVYALPRSESNLFWRLFANENALKRKKKKKAFFITLAVDNLGVDAERLLPSMRRYKKDAHHHGVAAEIVDSQCYEKGFCFFFFLVHFHWHTASKTN